MAENKMEMDPEVLRTTARKVETSAGDVRKELKRFTSVIEGLSSTWSSEVKDRFLQNYQKDRAALLEMAEQYTEVAEGLLGIADELEQTEEEISSRSVQRQRADAVPDFTGRWHMAGDGTSRINTEELLRAVQEITSIKKSIAANTDATYAIFRKLQDSYAGESADDIYAVAGQLRKSSGAIITMLGNYERVLKELAGVYEDTEKTVSRNAGRLKFGGMR